MFQRVRRLVDEACPKLPADVMCDILALRCAANTRLDELAATDTAQELVGDKTVAADVEMEAVPTPADQAAMASYRSELLKLRPKAKAVQRRRTTPTPGELTTAAVQALMPPKARVWKDTYNQRWQLSFAGERVASRSFALHGYDEAAKLIAQVAWQAHVSRGGAAPTDPAVRQFARWPAGGGAGRGAASSSSGARG